jgi:hypothetical protein
LRQRLSRRRVASDNQVGVVGPAVLCYKVRWHMRDSCHTEAQGVEASEEWDVALADRLVATADHPWMSVRKRYIEGQGQEKQRTDLLLGLVEDSGFRRSPANRTPSE